MTRDLYTEILDDVAKLVEASARRGKVSLAPETLEVLDRLGTEAPVQETPAREESTPSPAIEGHPSEATESLDQLRAAVEACRLCPLCETRTQTVFADGNPSASVVFVGEAPGQSEDEQGVPFVGKAGELLTSIIQNGMKLDRQRDTYICNVIKCRPPNNRDPNPEEKRHCMPYLERQLDLIRPKVIVALGRQASQSLLQTEESTGRLRNRWHEYRGIPLRVTYHPAYLLRSPSEKRKTWEDIQEVMKVLNGEIDSPV